MNKVAASSIGALAGEAVGPAGLRLVLRGPQHRAQLNLAVSKLAASAIAAGASIQPGTAQLGLREGKAEKCAQG